MIWLFVCVNGLELTQFWCEPVKYFHSWQCQCASDDSVVCCVQVGTQTRSILRYWIDVLDFFHAADIDPALSICFIQKKWSMDQTENWIITHFSLHISPMHPWHAEHTWQKMRVKDSLTVKTHSRRNKKNSTFFLLGLMFALQTAVRFWLSGLCKSWGMSDFGFLPPGVILPSLLIDVFLFFWGSSQTKAGIKRESFDQVKAFILTLLSKYKWCEITHIISYIQ